MGVLGAFLLARRKNAQKTGESEILNSLSEAGDFMENLTLVTVILGIALLLLSLIDKLLDIRNKK